MQIKYIDRNLHSPLPRKKSRLFIKVTLSYQVTVQGACAPIRRITESMNSENCQFTFLSKDMQVHYSCGEIICNSIQQLWNELLLLDIGLIYLHIFHRKQQLTR